MGKIIYTTDQSYKKLVKYAEECGNFVIGLIVGQCTLTETSIIHLSRTPEEKLNENTSEDVLMNKTLLTVSESWVADHAKHVTRMLPGGMFVIGIFVVSPENLFEDISILNKLKSILIYMLKSLDINNAYMFGNPNNVGERLIIHMSSENRVVSCISFDVNKDNRFNLGVGVDVKIVQKLFQWQQLECYYEFDEMYPVIVKKTSVSVKQQFQQILESASKMINLSIVFIDGELHDGKLPLEQIIKKKKQKTSKSSSKDVAKTMHVSLFVPLSNTLPDTVEYLECDGSVHFSGVVASNVFLPAKCLITEAISAVKQDLIRSLSARFTMHCDALIDDNLLPEEKVCFNEPPRRVSILFKDGSSLQFSDYLFPGEAPAEALLTVRELLDMEINESQVIYNIETPADTSEFDALDHDSTSEESLTNPQDASWVMYVTGISFALFVLILSIFIHYREKIYNIFS